MEGLLGHVIHNLSVSSVYEDGSCVDPHVPAVSLSYFTTLVIGASSLQFQFLLERDKAFFCNYPSPTHRIRKEPF